MKEIKFDGTQRSILKILHNLPEGSKWVCRNGKSITIPTSEGPRQVWKGEIVTIDGENVKVIEI